MPEGDTLFRTAAGLRPYLVGRTVTAARANGPGPVPQVHRVVGHRDRRGRGAGQEPPDPVRRRSRGPDAPADERVVASLPTGRTMAPAARPGPARPRGARRGRRLLRCAGRRALRDPRERGRTRRSAGSGRTCRRPTSIAEEARGGCATRREPTTDIADALLDQRALAGIGNVYKNEILWIERVSPFSPVAELDDATLDRLIATAQRLLVANAAPTHGPERVTTSGDRGAPGPVYVYGRAGRPCRRCRTPIRSTRQGRDLPRTTYWCPTCQGAADR